jgi:hypothetical protein
VQNFGVWLPPSRGPGQEGWRRWCVPVGRAPRRVRRRQGDAAGGGVRCREFTKMVSSTNGRRAKNGTEEEGR